jgi:hypothetical protein
MPLHDRPTVKQIARPTLREIDEGRAKAGLAVIAACAVFWSAVIWLILKVL